MPEQNNDPVFSGILYVGKIDGLKPYGSDGGQLYSFRGAHTTSYGGESTWYDCAIFDEVLIASLGDKGLYKGAILAVEGFVKDKTGNNGQVWHNLRVVKLGKIEWFQRRDKNAKPVTVTTPAAAMPTAEQVAAFLAAQGAAPKKDALPF